MNRRTYIEISAESESDSFVTLGGPFVGLPSESSKHWNPELYYEQASATMEWADLFQPGPIGAFVLWGEPTSIRLYSSKHVGDLVGVLARPIYCQLNYRLPELVTGIDYETEIVLPFTREINLFDSALYFAETEKFLRIEIPLAGAKDDTELCLTTYTYKPSVDVFFVLNCIETRRL
jgi:hypothetical protein